MTNETLYVVIWLAMILPIAVVCKYVCPKWKSSDITAGAIIWPVLLALGVLGAVFAFLALPHMALTKVVDYLAEGLREK